VVNTHLLAGAALMLTEESITSEGLWSAVRRHRCTSLGGVPYTYQTLRRLGLDSLNVPSILTCTQAGGRLDERHVLHFHEVMKHRGGRFFVMYGQTEAAPRIAILPSDDLPARPGSVGLPVPGGSFSLAPDGEVIYTGPNVMMGYALDRQDLTKGDELHGRLHTGDRGYLDEGYLYIQGRTGREVKLLGLRINLDDIENMLKAHGPTAVTGGEEKLRIFCEYGDQAAYRRYALELASKLNLNFGAFSFRHIDAIPLTGNGKTDYRKLAEIAE
jgi:acyl-CoA synthetase (AMP-forming)/AMP-acid ligase II